MGTTKGTQNELKSSISGTYRLKTEERRRTNNERRRTVENLREITHENVTEAPRLGFFSRKQFSSLILSDYEVPEGLNPFHLHSFLYLQENRGGACHPARPGEPSCFLQKQPPCGGTSWKAQVGLVAICTPFFTKYTPCFFGDSFSITLRNFTNFVTILVFFP